MLTHKFGGTSVLDAGRMQAVARLVAAEARPAVVVTSAMGGVTDELIALANLALARDMRGQEERHARLRMRHLEAVESLAPVGAAREALHGLVRELLLELEQLLQGVRLLRELSPRTLDVVVSLGERLAAPLLAQALRAHGCDSEWIDAREVMRTDDRFGGAAVDLAESRRLCREMLLPLCSTKVPVVTGFIARGPSGDTTTLGRGGSDYTATLLGSFLDADEIWIWTDVDGVMTADPRVVREARVLDAISYREAAEMAYFGSKVLHPSTMIPAVRAGIPIRIRNTLDPAASGTVIGGNPTGEFEGVKTVTSIAGLALVTVEGRGMSGVPGMAQRIFGATARAEVSVYMISQASSEQNITFLVPESDGERVVAELELELELEIQRQRVDKVTVHGPVGILAIIGEGMKGIPGISQRLFTAIGRAHVNILAIAQGSSELNVSVVVENSDLPRAVAATHTAFGLTRDTHVLLMGKGLIGRTLLEQLLGSSERLQRDHGLGIKVIGVCGRDQWLFDPEGITTDRLAHIAAGAALADVGGEARPSDDGILDRVVAAQRLDTVMVDATAAATEAMHRSALEHGLHVVSANKKPLSGAQADYQAIRAAALAGGVGYHFETTFGAGLPVLSTLQDLLATCDRVLSVRGCFSGTLGAICSGLEEGRAFSEVVIDAKASGFTEPDPRDDLSGMDVARKALIIAREIGVDMELDQVELEGLVPEEMMTGDVDSFMKRLPELDEELGRRAREAEAAGQVLRYLAEVSAERVAVGLRAVDRDTPAGQLRGPDNILIFTTERYREHPMVIRGPGAGAEVTAAGVFGDILKVARRL